MTSPCFGGFRRFDPNIRADLYFSENAGQALDAACQTGWQRSKAGDVFDVAAAVAVGGMRKGNWDCTKECGIFGSSSSAAAAADTDAYRPPSPIPTSTSTNYYSDQGGVGIGGGGGGGGGTSAGVGQGGWEGKARDDGRRGLCIDQVDDEGRFIRLVNDSETQDEEIGCCVLRQAFQGHAIIEFYFPPSIFLPAGSAVTVWSTGRSGTKDKDQPPADADDEPHWNFQFKELFRWASGHDYLTTLCRTNGTIIASSSQSFGSYGGSTTDKSVGPSPGIISKFNLITNRYKLRQDRERAVKGSISAEFAELLKKKTAHRFPPRFIRKDGIQTKPKGGQVRQSPSYKSNPCFPLIYPDWSDLI